MENGANPGRKPWNSAYVRACLPTFSASEIFVSGHHSGAEFSSVPNLTGSRAKCSLGSLRVCHVGGGDAFFAHTWNLGSILGTLDPIEKEGHMPGRLVRAQAPAGMGGTPAAAGKTALGDH